MTELLILALVLILLVQTVAYLRTRNRLAEETRRANDAESLRDTWADWSIKCQDESAKLYLKYIRPLPPRDERGRFVKREGV